MPIESPLITLPEYGANFRIIPTSNQLKELQTIIHDK